MQIFVRMQNCRNWQTDDCLSVQNIQILAPCFSTLNKGNILYTIIFTPLHHIHTMRFKFQFVELFAPQALLALPLGELAKIGSLEPIFD